MKFSPRPLPTVICLLLFVIMILLGFWQWTRYHSRMQIQSAFQAAIAAKPIPLSKLQALPNKEYRHVVVQGHYLSQHNFLLQHRYHHDRLGFEVLTPLQLANSNKVVLVNRGWIPATPALTPALKLARVSGWQTVTGYVFYPPAKAFTLGSNIVKPEQRPLQIQKIDLAEIHTIIKQPIYPFVLYLDKASQHGFVREWTPIVMDPRKHFGYMIQWFLMALALLIAYLAFSYERKS